MEVIWLLHGEVLSRLRRVLQHSARKLSSTTTESGSTIGPSAGRSKVSLEAFVTEVYRACLNTSSDQQRVPPTVGFAGGTKAGGRSQTEGGRHLLESICQLFDLVDIDSTNAIDWVDFTDFCVYMRGGGEGNKGPEDAGGGRDGSASGKLDNKDSDITRFTERRGYTDRSSHSHEIRSMRFVKELQLLMVVEGGPSVKIYRAGPHRIGEIEPAITMKKHLIESTARSMRLRQTGQRRTGSGTRTEGSADNTAVLAAEFIGHDNQAAMTCADGYLTVWELDTCRMLRYTRMRDVQVGLRFCPAMNVLASWGVDDFNHEILVWDVDDLTVVHVLNDGHSDPVKDVCEVALPSQEKDDDPVERPWDPMLVTAGMDGKVVVWDLRLGAEGKFRAPRKLFILTGHYHGILSLAYSDEHDLIISAGFDFDALCWERSTSHMHMKLEGHRRSLIGVQIVRHETQRAVTGDEGGSFRLWEIRRGPSDHGTCLQTFSLSNPRAAPRTMVIPWREGLVAAGSKMYIFRAERSLTIAATPGGAWFSPYTGELCVLLRNAVVLDGSTGSIVRRTFQQPPDREITAFCLDARHKKAVVGDQKGGLRMYDGVTGRCVMSATPHGSEVSALIFIDADCAFVSVGWDRQIQVHDATASAASAIGSEAQKLSASSGSTVPLAHRRRCKVLRSVVGAHEGDITLVAASAKHGLLATASSDFTVRVWDYSLLRLEEIIVGHREVITCLLFLDPLPCLATADMAGKVVIWATRPHSNAGKCLAVIRNTVITAGEIPKNSQPRARPRRKVLPTPVTSIAFCQRDTSKVDIGACEDSNKRAHQPSAIRDVASKSQEGQASTRSVKHKDSESHMYSVPDETKSLLFAGDELGTIKVWDISALIADKLGATTYCASVSEDAASALTVTAVPSDKNSHQFIHHRDSPLDGVSLHAATRFETLVEIGKILSQGGYLPSTQEEANNNKRQRDADRRSESATSERKRSGVECHASNGHPANNMDVISCSKSRGSTGFRIDSSPGVSSGMSTGMDERSTESKKGAKEAGDVYAKVEAVLNTQVSNIDPVVTWTGHSKSVTSLQVIMDPPAVLSGSLDGSTRLFALDGSQLGVLIDQNEPGVEPWRFKPPTTGRKKGASTRATALHERLESIRRAERRELASAHGVNKPVTRSKSRKALNHDSPKASDGVDRAKPTSDLTPNVPDTKKIDFTGNRGRLAAASSSPSGTGATATRAVRAESLDIRSALSVACLARVKGLAQPSHVASSESSRTSGKNDQPNNPRAPQESIDVRLMKEARDGQRYRSFDRPSPSVNPGQLLRGSSRQDDEERRRQREAWDMLPHKKPTNLNAEQERKYKKRTRSGMEFLSTSISKTKGIDCGGFEVDLLNRQSQPCLSHGGRGVMMPRRSVDDDVGRTVVKHAQNRPRTSPGMRTKKVFDNDQLKENDEQAAREIALTTGKASDASCGALRSCASAPVLRHAVMTMAPLLSWTLGTIGPLPSERNNNELGAKGIPFAHRSIATSARSFASSRSNGSLGSEFCRRLDADRRRRRIDRIIDGARRIEEDTGDASFEERPTTMSGGIGPFDTKSRCRTEKRKDESLNDTSIDAAGSPPGQEVLLSGRTTNRLSDRERTILDRFERLVYGDDGNGLQRTASGQWRGTEKGRSVLENRLREKRSAARKSAVRHNNRYRRAKRFNLNAMKETQQRRQEATVGLTGPSGERFGPYSLEDVFDFQAFASHLGAQGADLLTVRGLLSNPGIQDDPYTHALLQELARTRVLHWNQALSFEDLMQLVFHFAKQEELKRMINAIEIALLLERARDAHLSAKGRQSFLTEPNNTLASHIASDIDITFRATCTEASGTCTLKELSAMMSRAGSDLFALRHDELEALAIGCGVDGNKELTARDMTAIITKLALLQRCGHANQQQSSEG